MFAIAAKRKRHRERRKTAADGVRAAGGSGGRRGTGGTPSPGLRGGLRRDLPLPARPPAPLRRTPSGCPGPAGGRAGTGSPVPPGSAGAWAPEGGRETPAGECYPRTLHSLSHPPEMEDEKREALGCTSAGGTLSEGRVRYHCGGWRRETVKALALSEECLPPWEPWGLWHCCLRGEKVPHCHCLGTAVWTLAGKRSLITLRDQPLPFVTRPSLSGIAAINIWGWEVTHTTTR